MIKKINLKNNLTSLFYSLSKIHLLWISTAVLFGGFWLRDWKISWGWQICITKRSKVPKGQKLKLYLSRTKMIICSLKQTSTKTYCGFFFLWRLFGALIKKNFGQIWHVKTASYNGARMVYKPAILNYIFCYVKKCVTEKRT